MTAVLLKTESDSKHFPTINSYFSYQDAQNQSKKNRMELTPMWS
jgi:hypothetical protein